MSLRLGTGLNGRSVLGKVLGRLRDVEWVEESERELLFGGCYGMDEMEK